MEIVKAALEDAEALASICAASIAASFPRWYPADAVRFFLDLHSKDNIAADIREGRVFACMAEGCACGTITITGNELSRLFVLPQRQGKGCGKALLDFAESRVLAEFNLVKLDSSLPAREMYLKRGYKETGFYSYKTEGGDFLCWFAMEKRMEPPKESLALKGSPLYDDGAFFEAYSQMERSVKGLEGAGEWHLLKKLFPADLSGASVLDLGCGYGWHCKYTEELGAKLVVGIDASEKMIEAAKAKNAGANIFYINAKIEEYDFPPARFDLVVSNLALHYIEDIASIFRKIAASLKPRGAFILNIEHPTFTAGVNQDWVYGEDGKPLYWPVDGYFYPGPRAVQFLGRRVVKQHHTLSQIAGGLLDAGLAITALEEAAPSAEALRRPEMQDEMRRPMMLLVRAEKAEQNLADSLQPNQS